MDSGSTSYPVRVNPVPQMQDCPTDDDDDGSTTGDVVVALLLLALSSPTGIEPAKHSRILKQGVMSATSEAVPSTHSVQTTPAPPSSTVSAPPYPERQPWTVTEPSRVATGKPTVPSSRGRGPSA